MKKTLIALAVSAAAVATGVNAGELYNQDGTSLTMGGRAEARMSVRDGKVDDLTRVRLNFLGKTQINDSLYGVGFYEGEFTTADNDSAGSDLDNRYTYAGLGGKFGEVTYGKNDGALGVITDYTDIFSGLAGNTAADKLAVADRTDNMLSYKGKFADLSLKASYRFADSNSDLKGDNGQDGYSLSAIYAFGDTGLTAGAGYAAQDEANEYMLAASYTVADFYIAGVFTDGEKQVSNSNKNTYDYTGYELAASYTLNQTVFTTAYNYAETNDETSVDNYAIEAAYFFKPNFRAFLSYNFNLIDEGDTIGQVSAVNDVATKAQAEDTLGLGLRYDF
ncbi:porin [Vibrio fluvialis]|uniref:porin n=1 Tax=Vibrio fluvialis TaxID=676 RepID=UPI00192C0967|nr:porin [Vibrio fluvialis]EKO3467934.1 porin [Vibrio fluvialis]MBL4262011.1 porin [Vibrio fluvialis]MBY7863510.1 porin [Vibrio fluvialis]MBY7889369.1 porin [Vibrio fluvialis]MBY8154387.1 porin [Vibrio fluvialis]